MDYQKLQELLVTRFWHPVALKCEISKPGDWLRFEIGSRDIIIYNDNSSIIAFENRCPHRGARFFEEDTGNSKILCRYHGWGYRNGRMLYPKNVQFEPDAKIKPCLTTYHVSFCGDLIFMAVDPIEDLLEQLTCEIYAELNEISTNLVNCVDFNRYNFSSCWPVAVENALEPYHIPFVHQHTLGRLKLDAGVNTYMNKNSVWRSPIGDKRILKTLKMISTEALHQSLANEGYRSIYLFPFSMVSDTAGLSYSLQNFFPEKKFETDSTRFTSRLYSLPVEKNTKGSIYQTFLKSTADVNRQVFKEDEEICSLISHENWSLIPSVGYFMANEEKAQHFRRSCLSLIEHLV